MVWKWGEEEEEMQVRRSKGKKGGEGIREDREEMRRQGVKRRGGAKGREEEKDVHKCSKGSSITRVVDNGLVAVIVRG